MDNVLQRAQAINARTQGWLSQFNRRTVGPAEAAQIQRVLDDTLQHLHGLLKEAPNEPYLHGTLRDLAAARGIYHGMVQTHQTQQRQRINYGFQAMATSNQAMAQASFAIAQRMARALSLTIGGGAGMAMPMMMPPAMVPAPAPGRLA